MFLDPAPFPRLAFVLSKVAAPSHTHTRLSICLLTDPEIICSTAFRFTTTLTTFSFYIGLHDFNKNAISEEWGHFYHIIFSLRAIGESSTRTQMKSYTRQLACFVLQGEGSIGITLMPDLDAGCRQHFSLFKAYY